MHNAFDAWQRALLTVGRRQAAAAYCAFVKAQNEWAAQGSRTDEYRKRLIAAPGRHTSEQWFGRVEFYGWRCAYCGLRLTTKTLVKEHAIPLSRGGTNWPANLMPACKPCNSRKRDKTPLEDGWRFS